ncbi:hypothetical protein [Fibrella forsythiae]|uniref:ZU5 domain-containing protein n=1 Tax=Fibrella forsythiae TaxID=2817061 RepID=A0ABS3JV36_9BACT|nr:hypothetical protein [Fibrella forsythiae]MBO0953054.1 hypothetical protein [Fibrella forsythiae]
MSISFMFLSILRKTGYALSLLGLALACKSGGDTVTPPEPTKPGVPTAVGNPLGAAVSKTIGPAGGTLSSADGSMTLRFPAGALTQETLITVQPVENTAFGGAGVGYEFGPHGTQFKKPVTLSWTYKEEDLRGSSPAALGIAYQDEQGIWQGRDNLAAIPAQHRVVAPLYHFSRYSFYENFWLNPVDRTLAPNETVEFKVFYQENSRKFPGSIDDSENETNLKPADTLTVPSGPTLDDMVHSLVPTVQLLTANQVKNWRVNGQDVIGRVDSPTGFLSYHEGKSVIYKAPAKAPEANPVAVSVEVITPGKGKLMLVRNMTIESPNELYIGGAKYDPAFAEADIVDGYLAVFVTGKPRDNTRQPGVFIQLTGIHGPGSFNLGKENKNKLTVSGFDQGGTAYEWHYLPEQREEVFGPGNVTITEYNVKDRIVAGSFSGTLHYYNRETKAYKSLSVKGQFRTGGG